MNREFSLRVSHVSDSVTAAARCQILGTFPGFFQIIGQGVYTFEDGTLAAEESVEFRVATSGVAWESVLTFVADFARSYCYAGRQETVYFLAPSGRAYLVNGAGQFLPLDGLPRAAIHSRYINAA